jgi:signal transduction histidine kinase
VRGFAELHGGSLSVGRRMGVGAYATVHFPPERLIPKRPLVRLIEAA